MARTGASKRARREVGPSRPSGPRPDWSRTTTLSSLPEEWREQLYRDKLNRVGLKQNLICAERKTYIPDFNDYGLVWCFERLGWMDALDATNLDSKHIYLNEIIEWMTKVKKIPGHQPPRTTQLVGRVRNKDVVLSFETIDEIAYDTGAIKPTRPYVPVDYCTRPLDANLPPPGYPQMHPPDWWPLSSDSFGTGEGSSSSGQPRNVFETSDLATSLYKAVFNTCRGDHDQNTH